MTDKEITNTIRELELDINKILEEFYYQKPKIVQIRTWALHTTYSISKEVMETIRILAENKTEATT